jgi:Sulfotransferase domain
MRVIGSGFGRTGTLSLQAALQQLGFDPCYHMLEVGRTRGHPRKWLAIARGEAPDWRVLFEGFEATVDFPACLFYADLMREFPDAKVVHTVRNVDDWYRSTFETLYQARTVVPRLLMRSIRTIGDVFEMVERLIWDGVFEGRFDDPRRAKEIFNEHTVQVCNTVPAERLLVYDVRDGWAPLCQFLRVPVPSTAFPNINDRASMVRRLRRIRWVTHVGPWLLAALIACLAVAYLR